MIQFFIKIDTADINKINLYLHKGGFLDCKDLHDGTCIEESILRFVTVFKNTYKYYIPIHLIPLIIFKRR